MNRMLFIFLSAFGNGLSLQLFSVKRIILQTTREMYPNTCGQCMVVWKEGYFILGALEIFSERPA